MDFPPNRELSQNQPLPPSKIRDPRFLFALQSCQRLIEPLITERITATAPGGRCGRAIRLTIAGPIGVADLVRGLWLRTRQPGIGSRPLRKTLAVACTNATVGR